LTGYRNATPNVPGWLVVSEDGLIIDIEQFIPGLFGKVELLDESIYNSPKTVKTSSRETWRLLGKEVRGGAIVVGIVAPENDQTADQKLQKNAAKLGGTLQEAMAVKSREIDSDVDYAIVNSDGALAYAFGGVPLKTNAQSLLQLPRGLTRFVSNGKPYLLYCRPLLNSLNQRVGVVIVPKDVSLEEEALRAQDRFNYLIVAAAGILILILVVRFVGRELLSRSNQITLQEALKLGESRFVEFKSTFQWDVKQGKRNDDRRLDTLKSIAAFLNGNGGSLFIGIEENRVGSAKVCGINEDLWEMGGSRDRLQRLLRDLVTDRIGSEFSPFIEERFEEIDGQVCWVILVEAAPRPAFVRWRGQKKFYVREGPKTSDLDNENTWRYIKNRWG
jgi:Putative DNA-binding domain